MQKIDTNNLKGRTIHLQDKYTVQVIDQRRLPHELIIQDLHTSEQIFWAIRNMVVRGAPLIGATAAYGMYFACLEAQKQKNAEKMHL